MNRTSTLLFFFVSWSIATAVFLLIRYYGSAEVPLFGQAPATMLLIWFVAAFLLSLADYGCTEISDWPSLRMKLLT